MKTINLKVTPLIAAMALASASVGHINAQPIVSIGGSINASAAASISSSFPTLNASQAFNVGYAGNADVAFPSDMDAVQSVISELSADSGGNGSLAGLSDMTQPDAPSMDGPSGEGSASLITDTASEASGKLQGGGNSTPSGDFVASSVTSTASDASGRLQGGNSGPSGDVIVSSATSTASEVSGKLQGGDDLTDSGQPSDQPDPTQSVRDVAVNASLVTDTTAEIAGRISGAGEPGQGMDVLVSAASDTAAELTASLQNTSPEDVSPSDQETGTGEDQPEPLEEGDDVAEAPDSQPEVESAELAAAVENRSKAEAFATLYR